jgi:chemotaxis protein MotA
MKRPDYAIPTGLLIGLVAILGCAVLEGIRLRFLWQPTAALVVFGGTAGAVVVKRGLLGLKSAARAAWSLFFTEPTDNLEANVARLVWLARAEKREGVRVFESYAETADDPLVARGLQRMAEYADASALREELELMLDCEHERGMHDVATIEAAAGYAPTFGILGAVLGLIHVLRALADPGTLGAGIATAFVATLYGVGGANLLLFPLASRLRERLESRMKRREALVEALVALAAHESPVTITNRFTAHAALDPEDSPTTLKQATR